MTPVPPVTRIFIASPMSHSDLRAGRKGRISARYLGCYTPSSCVVPVNAGATWLGPDRTRPRPTMLRSISSVLLFALAACSSQSATTVWFGAAGPWHEGYGLANKQGIQLALDE